jgi:hypothetical protein
MYRPARFRASLSENSRNARLPFYEIHRRRSPNVISDLSQAIRMGASRQAFFDFFRRNRGFRPPPRSVEGGAKAVDVEKNARNEIVTMLAR